MLVDRAANLTDSAYGTLITYHGLPDSFPLRLYLDLETIKRHWSREPRLKIAGSCKDER